MKKYFQFILIVLNLSVTVGIFISYLSVYISPASFWPLSFFGLAYPFLLTANILFMILWFLIQPRYSLISLAAVLVGAGFVFRFVQIKGKIMDKTDIKVLSYNVNHFTGEGHNQQKETALQITDFLKAEQPDIICLQEIRLRKNRIFNLNETVKELDFIQHYQFARSSSTFGSATLTRYPIIFMDEIRFENSRNMTIFTDVLIGEDTVRIFNVHLHSYGIDPREYSIIDSGVVSSEEDLKEAREVVSKLKRGFLRRARQAQTIRKFIEESPYHVIVCGDLNDTPASYSYGQISKEMKDAFVVSGKGLGQTYVGKLPSFRIDFIFHSTGFDSFNFKTHPFMKSDHLPVSCGLIKK